MIELKGISVQTRILLLAGAAIAAIIILWPEDDRKSEAGTATLSEPATASRKQTVRKFEERLLWQQQPGFNQQFSSQQTFPGNTGQYPTRPPARQVPHYPQQAGPYDGYRFRSPDANETIQPRALPPPYPEQAQQRQSPYYHTPQLQAPQFRPLEKPKPQTRRYSGGYPNAEFHDPAMSYPPQISTPEPSTPHTGRYGTPWEYPAYPDYPQATIPPEYGSHPGY